MSKDTRSGRKQSAALERDYYAQDLHKSMFVKDLKVTVPSFYVEKWPVALTANHMKGQGWDDVLLRYHPPTTGQAKSSPIEFHVKLRITNSAGRRKESSYRLTWRKDFAAQLARDYPQSFVRSLEFVIGDNFYKQRGFSEYDIGGFKEQVQIRIQWKGGIPEVDVRELFRVREEVQLFPNVYREMGPFLIASHIEKGTGKQGKPLIGKWRKRADLPRELKENVLYVLANKSTGELYVGETKKSLSSRYPVSSAHHTWDDWEEYCVVQLPSDTPDSVRKLSERLVISLLSQIFKSGISGGNPIFHEKEILVKNKSY